MITRSFLLHVSHLCDVLAPLSGAAAERLILSEAVLVAVLQDVEAKEGMQAGLA